MKKFTIFGDPVSHSKSPAMQNSGLKILKIKANYDATLLKDGKDIKKIFLRLWFVKLKNCVPREKK